jgi:hypothetical protein
MTIHSLQKGQSIQLPVHACELFSKERLAVQAGEEYEFSCEGKQRWKDWWIKSSPDGFFNPLAMAFGLRVKGVKCFCLCGALNEDLRSAFPIGSSKKAPVTESGTLSFFANDAEKYYGNNSGHIQVKVKRLV